MAALLTGWALAQGPFPSTQPRGTATKPPPAAATDAKPESKPAEAIQLREGMELVDQLGQFKVSHERTIVALAEGNRQLIVLENLCLERVVKILAGNPEAGNWLVSGTVTEYRGANYVLLRRAVLKGQSSATGKQ
jgi:hypothetical protein